jgi:hypothetical protein
MKYLNYFFFINKIIIFIFFIIELNKLYGDVVMEMSGNVPIISLYNRQDIEKVISYNAGKFNRQ